MFKPSKERDQALLNALAQQAIRVPVPMICVAIVISGLAYGKAPTAWVLLWGILTASMQLVRFTIVRKLAVDAQRSTTQRLRVASTLSLANGLILASSVLFFSYLDETSRAVYSMIMVGIVAGTIATSYGYRPIFMGLVVPILSAISFGWLVTSGDTLSTLQTVAISVLTIALGLLLYASSRDVYKAFGESFEAHQKLEAALESERSANAAKTRFLAAASHDLRQPLHAMSMLSAALTLRELDEKSSIIAEKMNMAMGDLSNELDSLLDISKLDAGVMRVHPTEFLLSASLNRIAANYQGIATQNNLDLLVDCADDVHLLVDKALLERVIRNLLDNAIKYTIDGSISISTSKRRDICTIVIQDTGIGIPEHEQLRVKEEFYQLSNPERDRQKGLGLGLSIVWRLVPLINAQLHMQSEVNVGTRYELKIPIHTPTRIAVKEKPETSNKNAVNTLMDEIHGKRVLIVEDDLDVRLGTRTLLENSGFIVQEAVNSIGAATVLQQNDIDIALVDLRLPNGDSGFSTIERLRDIQKDLPIVILSGETSPDVLQQAAHAGCEFLVKPVDMKELIGEMHRTLAPEKREMHE